jgi:ABC-2 type transport system ATP-binding protein
MPANDLLLLRDVRKRHGAHDVLDGLDLEVKRGEVVALLGANGAGKSTALRIALGLDSADAGQAMLMGQPAAQADAALRRRVAFIPETVGLYEELTARESVRYLTHVATGRKPSAAEVDDGLRLAGLAEAAFDRTVRALSKGMRQKVCIALALCKHAELLVLDEPTSGLDVRSSIELNGILRALADRGVGVILATHDLLRARSLADRFLLLAQGCIAARFERADIDIEQIEALFVQGA